MCALIFMRTRIRK